MSLDAQTMRELEVLLAVLADGTLSPDQRARLNTILCEHPEAQRFYQRYIELHVMLEWESGVAVQATEPGDVLSDLLQAERDAEIIAFPQRSFEPLPSAVKADQLTWHKVRSATAYLLSRPKPWAAIAAVLALALVLAVVFRPGPTPPPLANHPNAPTTPGNTPHTQTNPVATLTAERNAVWSTASAEGALAPGSPLRAGQRLTLTQGFAEITTNDGAIAILEAPATIELTDNDNAIRLHAGKLVGICETESSKGFLVRTLHMDVTDLGTRFGVAIDEQGSTLAEVFTGSVVVKPFSHGDAVSPRVLTTEQSLTLDETGREMAREQFAALPFARLLGTQMPIVPIAYTYGANEASEPAPLTHQLGVISDPERTKLTDGVLSTKAHWRDGTSAGFRDDVDNGAPQPRVDFDLGGLYDVTSITLSAALYFQSDADESVRVYASTDGVRYSEPVVSPYGTPWRSGAGGLRQLTIDLSALPDTAYIRVEIYDKDQWTILSEIDFYGRSVTSVDQTP